MATRKECGFRWVVVFDLGGVLVRVNLDWGSAMRRAGLVPECERFAGVPLDACPGFHEHEVGALSDDAYLASLANFLELPVEQAHGAHLGILGEEMAGAGALVRDLAAEGVPSVCLSNTNGLHWAFLGADSPYSSVRALHRRFGSHEIGARKPDPAAYAAVEREFPGCRFLFFDDSPTNTQAARALGWEAFHVRPTDSVEPLRRKLAELGVLKGGT
ncbi:MAG: HAD-IA family hydrolase [Fimbriimonadaceae bacterium]